MGGQIHPLNDGQRFWFVTDNEDTEKLCMYIRDITYNERATATNDVLSADDSFGTMKHTGSSDFALPTGAILQVYTPTQLQGVADNDNEPPQWPKNQSHKGYQWYTTDPADLERRFRGLPLTTTSSAAKLLYGLNMHQAQAESIFTGLTTLHPNGHYKYYAENTKRLYLDKEGFAQDTVEFYVISDDVFLVGDRISFMSHGNIDGSITTTDGGRLLDFTKVRAEAVFWCYRFRYTIVA